MGYKMIREWFMTKANPYDGVPTYMWGDWEVSYYFDRSGPHVGILRAKGCNYDPNDYTSTKRSFGPVFVKRNNPRLRISAYLILRWPTRLTDGGEEGLTLCGAEFHFRKFTIRIPLFYGRWIIGKRETAEAVNSRLVKRGAQTE